MTRMFPGFWSGLRRIFRHKTRKKTLKNRGQLGGRSISIANVHITEEQPKKKGRRIPSVTASELNDDVLLNIFDWYRLCNTTNEGCDWISEHWWYKLIHVCRKWRHLILTSPTRFDLHLVCTYGIPVETMLSHSPPLPLILYYPEISDTISTADEESVILALQQNERVRRIHIAAPTEALCNVLKVMDCAFPMLEVLSLHLSTKSRAGLGLPEKFQSSLLRHLTLSNISLPIQSQLLRQAEGLITLQLWDFPVFPEFHPAHLVAQLPGMSRLETLAVQFYASNPMRIFESPAQQKPITLPSLKFLTFRGDITYLEGILARINAPLLSTFNIEFFHQLTFNLTRLLYFVGATSMDSFRSVAIHFNRQFVSLTVHPERGGSYPFLVLVKCQSLGLQAACVAQICQTLGPLLVRAEILTVGFHEDGSGPWKDEIDVEKWHDILRTFSGVKSLRVVGRYVGDLFRSLQLDEWQLPLEEVPMPAEMCLSPGWEVRYNWRGSPYYVDHNTRTTTWTRPPPALFTLIPPAHVLSTRVVDTTLSPNTANANDTYVDEHLVPLPQGWEVLFTANGRPYFVDHHTRTTTWKDPRDSVSAATTTTLANRVTLGLLPSGWEISKTVTGRTYFTDHNTHTTTWLDPRLPSTA